MLSMQSRRRADQRGLTLVELLVAMGIIAVLLAISLPAIMMAMESSRRASCQNNLRQIALATSSYVAAHRFQPVFREPPGKTVFVPLLPFLDQKPLADRIQAIELRPDWVEQGDPHGFGGLDVMQCPSTAGARDVGGTYLPNAGNYGPSGFDGAFTDPKAAPLPIDAIIDGLSQTAFYSETKANVGLWDIPSYTLPEERAVMALACSSHHPWSGDFPGFSNYRQWWNGFLAHYNHSAPPGRGSCLPHDHTLYYAALTPTSDHPGGVNVAYGDGHTVFVPHEINLMVWVRSGTRAGTEINPYPF